MPLSTLDTLRATVAALTHATGESQAVLAAGIGLTQSQVSRRQNGPSSWTLDDVDALATHWGIPVLDLLAGPSRAAELLPEQRRRPAARVQSPTPVPPSLPASARAPQPQAPGPASAPATVQQQMPAPVAAAPQVAEPDRTSTGASIVAAPAPCVLCGGPTPYRAAGRPQHLHGMCQTVTVPHSAPAPEPVTATPQPAASGPSPVATDPATTPRPRKEPAADLLPLITDTVAGELDRHGGDMEAATAGLIKRAIKDAMALLDACRVGSRYEFTAYPPLPEIVRKKSRSGADEVWEARPKWRNRTLGRSRGPEQAVTVLDMNGAYLSALKTHLPIGQLKHDPAGGFDPKMSGLYLVTPPAWDHEDIPNPLGARDEPGPLWLTGPTLRLLLRLAGPKYGLCEQPAIHEAWTAYSTENLLEKFRQTLATARDHALEMDDAVTLEYVKAMYSKFVSTIGESGSNHQIRRPDWMHLIRSQAFTNLWLKGLKAYEAGLTLVQMAGTDELHLIGDWQKVFPEGRKISQVKCKDQYTIGGES